MFGQSFGGSYAHMQTRKAKIKTQAPKAKQVLSFLDEIDVILSKSCQQGERSICIWFRLQKLTSMNFARCSGLMSLVAAKKRSKKLPSAARVKRKVWVVLRCILHSCPCISLLHVKRAFVSTVGSESATTI